MASGIFFGNPGNFPIGIELAPVVVEVALPAGSLTYPQEILLSPVVVDVVIPDVEITSSLPTTLPDRANERIGWIMDRPSVTFDGSGLVNRIIPFGRDSDDSDLTIQHASPSILPYVIKTDGTFYYLEDEASILKYGLYEQKVYYTSFKNPFPNKATGSVTLAVNPTAGDTITIGDTTYTFVTSITAPYQILIGATIYETRQNMYATVNGVDGISPRVRDVTFNPFNPEGILGMTAATSGAGGNDIPLSGIFEDIENGVSGANLTGGAYATATANAVYYAAVNALLKGRSEILSMQIGIANGANCWALPGDRVKVRFKGWADTQDSRQLLGSAAPRVEWLDIDDWFLVTERHDKSDPSGARWVDFALAAPMMQYAVPAIPEWIDPVALPEPPPTGSSPNTGLPPWSPIWPEDPGDPDLPPGFPVSRDVDNPHTSGLGDILPKMLTGDGLPFHQCCPDPTTDIFTISNPGPPGDGFTFGWLGLSGLIVGGSDPDPSADYPITLDSVIIVGIEGTDFRPDAITGENITITQVADSDNFVGGGGSPWFTSYNTRWTFYIITADNADAVYHLERPGLAALARLVCSENIPNGISYTTDYTANQGSYTPPTSVISNTLTATVADGDNAQDAIIAFAQDSGNALDTDPLPGEDTLIHWTVNGQTWYTRTAVFGSGAILPTGTLRGTVWPFTGLSEVGSVHGYINPGAVHPDTDRFYWTFLQLVRVHLNDRV